MKYLWIDWSRLPVHGGPGLIFAIGIMVLAALAFPVILKLMIPAAIAGAAGGLIVNWWRNR
ncbi:MAG: hypothetical protein HYY26_00770 [Acidobacteria bacterium]|nr:hypothetical protein [Acidobacteriota bacterium]